MLPAALPWDFGLILFVLAVVVPWRGTVRIRKLLSRPELHTAERLSLYASTIAFQWLAVAVVAWRCAARGYTPAQLAVTLGDSIRTAGTALILSALLVASQVFGLRRMARVPRDRRGFLSQIAEKLMPHNAVETLAFVALVVTVALCEEFLYRGFVFAVALNLLYRSEILAIIASSALFAFAHLYQGRRGLMSTFVVGAAFAASRTWTGSLAPSVLAHLLADLVPGLLAGRLLSARTPAPEPETAPVAESNKASESANPRNS